MHCCPFVHAMIENKLNRRKPRPQNPRPPRPAPPAPAPQPLEAIPTIHHQQQFISRTSIKKWFFCCSNMPNRAAPSLHSI
jgi:hypothetical protein